MSVHIFVAPLKQTVRLDFEVQLGAAAKDANALALLKDLTTSRAALLDLMGKWEAPHDLFLDASQEYLSLLKGLIDSAERTSSISTPANSSESGNAASATASAADSPASIASTASASSVGKLRRLIQFNWTNVLGNIKISSDNDAQFELISILEDMAIWFTKKANLILSKSMLEEEELKESFKYLKIAAGILSHVETAELPRLTTSASPSDGNPVAVRAYIAQVLAEAQEITLQRGIEKKHQPSLLCSIARDISEKFEAAGSGIQQVKSADSKKDKWGKYLAWKHLYYQTFAYSFLGLHLLTKDQCGDAIRVFSEAENLFEKSNAAGKAYCDCEPRTPLKIHDLPATQLLARQLRESSAKAKRENDFIYFQKIPEALPELLSARALAEPEIYNMPSVSPKWTPEILNHYDASKVKVEAPISDPAEKQEEEKKTTAAAQHPVDKGACNIL